TRDGAATNAAAIGAGSNVLTASRPIDKLLHILETLRVLSRNSHRSLLLGEVHVERGCTSAFRLVVQIGANALPRAIGVWRRVGNAVSRVLARVQVEADTRPGNRRHNVGLPRG